jgi:hypothetical protein
MGDPRQPEAKPRHYCRGCGGPLAPDFKGLFHPDCLKADKRRRMREKRNWERKRIWIWLRKHGCGECQARFRSQAGIGREPSNKRLCEVSQGPSKPQKAQTGRGSIPKELPTASTVGNPEGPEAI